MITLLHPLSAYQNSLLPDGSNRKWIYLVVCFLILLAMRPVFVHAAHNPATIQTKQNKRFETLHLPNQPSLLNTIESWCIVNPLLTFQSAANMPANVDGYDLQGEIIEPSSAMYTRMGTEKSLILNQDQKLKKVSISFRAKNHLVKN